MALGRKPPTMEDQALKIWTNFVVGALVQYFEQ